MADDREQRLATLVARMEEFASGGDCSLAAANAIEGGIAALFPADDNPLQELADLLAQYRPGGGDLLFSGADMRPEMRWHLDILRRSTANLPEVKTARTPVNEP